MRLDLLQTAFKTACQTTDKALDQAIDKTFKMALKQPLKLVEKLAEKQPLVLAKSQLKSSPFSATKKRCKSLLCIVLGSFFLLGVTGCYDEKLDLHYGHNSGPSSTGVNGLGVFSEMLEKAGHKTYFWKNLSPGLAEADVVVWAPDSYSLPCEEVENWFRDWLENPNKKKTFIYIGRDYSAGARYWDAVTKNYTGVVQQEAIIRKKDCESSEVIGRANMSDEPGLFYSVDSTTLTKATKLKKLTGPWARGLDASKAELTHQNKIVLNRDLLGPNITFLLADENSQPFVTEIVFESKMYSDYTNSPDYSGYESRQDFETADEPQEQLTLLTQGSKMLVLENGSFLLNYPLMNNEHRKLAGKLISYLGKEPKRVVFLRSKNPRIYDYDPSDHPPTGFLLFTVWPINVVLFHLVAIGLLYVFSRYPIFGIPKNLESESKSDFGKHVRAMGKLATKTNDFSYALARIRAFHHIFQSDREHSQNLSSRPNEPNK